MKLELQTNTNLKSLVKRGMDMMNSYRFLLLDLKYNRVVVSDGSYLATIPVKRLDDTAPEKEFWSIPLHVLAESDRTWEVDEEMGTVRVNGKLWTMTQDGFKPDMVRRIIRKAVTQKAKTHTVTLDIDLLQAALTALKTSKQGLNNLVLTFNLEDDTAPIIAERLYTHDEIALIMPMRINSHPTGKDYWRALLGTSNIYE
jgi:hypothetical protein